MNDYGESSDPSLPAYYDDGGVEPKPYAFGDGPTGVYTPPAVRAVNVTGGDAGPVDEVRGPQSGVYRTQGDAQGREATQAQQGPGLGTLIFGGLILYALFGGKGK